MILKRLTANGFKSFADKIELEFGRGITCIVGPNGCGKSNVVDALKWVLGEQSAKSLRGQQMMDVIFNGSGTRKGMGLAQVDLTFDNSDGSLATDQSEVVVSRRLYRTGESEYLLNKQVCRLKDIRELFMDTGIGVDAYSVIEQGRVDVLLQANAADRRQIFEEAAGISKYKVRKKEAQRRLEHVNQNLLRVQDVVDELEKRLRSVKLAAGKARNYQASMQRLRELRSRYALAEYHRLTLDRSALDRRIAELSDQAAGLRTELSAHETRISQSNVRVIELDQEISQVEGRLLGAASQISAQEERQAAAQRRVADQGELLARSRERLASLESRQADHEGRLAELEGQLRRAETELNDVQTELDALHVQDRDLAGQVGEAQLRLTDEKEGVIDLLRRSSQLSNAISSLTLEHEGLARQKSRLDERDAQIAAELSAALEHQAQLAAKQSEVERLLSDQQAKLRETEARAAALAREREALADQLTAAKESRGGLESRSQLLGEMDRRHEGLLAGAKEILDKRDAAAGVPAAFSYVLGAVGELFEADAAHASLVEAVLGHYEKYLVVTERSRLLADQASWSDLSGPLRAFCLDCVPPALAGPDLSSHEGVVARLIDWVRIPEACGRLGRYLLGRTYVVESVEVAQTLSALDPSGARFVTVGGVVWEPDGQVGFGPLGSGSGLISRRSELREVEKQLEEVRQRIAELSDALSERAGEAQHIEGVQSHLQQALYDTNTHFVEVRAELASFDETIRRLAEERPLIASEVTQIAARLSETRARESSERDQLHSLEGRSRESEQTIAALQESVESLSEKRAVLAESITQARVRHGELSQRREALLGAIADLRAGGERLQTDCEKAGRELAETEERIGDSQRQIAEATSALAGLRVQHQEWTALSQRLRAERDEQRQTADQSTAESRRLRLEVEALDAELHAQQIKHHEATVRTEDLVARIAEELSVDLAEQYRSYQPSEAGDWSAVEEEINDLRQKLERLGNVNLDAIDEQAQIEERLAFLKGQSDDLRESERQLLSLIEKLNVESRQRFLTTFQTVSEHFSALFKKLFGGGRAELTLLDPSDVLECGIEVIARPPGKEPQSISLLSGGEKTLTAIALLMAVFRSRPSPFVLLDEVDAALDEANNVRFNHVVEEFSEISQFILITHSKRTMSIADVMYGITMQEAGVSQRVSVRFEDERQQPAVA